MSNTCKTTCRSKPKRRTPRSICALSLNAFGLGALVASPAIASGHVHRFNIPAETIAEAIIDIATQANVSIGGIDPSLCGSKAPAVRGDMTVDAALSILLTHSHCRAERLDDKAFILRKRSFLSSFRTPSRPATAPIMQPQPEIVVTANRRPQLAGNSPSAISVISWQNLQAGGGDLASAASRVAGLSLTNLGPGRNKILLRGLSDGVFTGRTQSTVGLYLDDAPITYNAPDPDLLLADMARVEVLKGPQGALYGEGSISGVVRLVTNPPDTSANSASLSAGIGATQDSALSKQVIAMGNLAVVRDRLATRLVIYEDDQGGYIDNLANGRHDINFVRRRGGRLSALWRVTPDWSLRGNYAAQEINARDSQYVTGDFGSYARSTAVAEPHDNDFNSASLDLTGDTAVGQLKITIGHLHHDISSRYEASSARVYDQDQAVELSTREITLSSPSDGHWRWMVGGFSSKSIERFTPALTNPAIGEPIFSEQRRDNITTMAVFGEAALDLTPKMTVALGLRDSRSEHAVSSSSAGTGAPILDHTTSDRLSHQISLRYRPSDTATIYLLTAEGYRNGGFNTTHLAGSPAIPARYDGDELNSYEAGLKVRWPAHELKLSLAAYRVCWRNLQSDQLQATGLPMTVNIGNGTNTGLEIEGDWSPLPPLHLHAAALFNEPKLTRPNPDFVTDEDAGLPYIARRSYSFSADWEKPTAAGLWRSSAFYEWRGKSRLNFGALQTVEMGGYGVLNLSTALEHGDMRYDVRIDNAGGVSGNSFAYGNPFSVGGQEQRTPERPRTLWVTLSRRF